MWGTTRFVFLLSVLEFLLVQIFATSNPPGTGTSLNGDVTSGVLDDAKTGTIFQGDFVRVETQPAPRRRHKRAVFNSTKFTWPHRIPFLIDDSYNDEKANKIRRILRYVEGRLCVTFHEEPNFDGDNNDYETNAYMKFVLSSWCSAGFGRGSSDSGPRLVRSCSYFYVMIHEIFHSLGVMHEHQSPSGYKYISTIRANIKPSELTQFRVYDDVANIVETNFDSSSIVMYSRKLFSLDGMYTFLPLRDEAFEVFNTDKTNLDNIFHDLNIAYKCQELYCNESQVDCGLGYYAKIKGQCACVCPDGFDPLTRCQTLVTADSYEAVEWPDTPFAMYAGQADRCPEGFDKGVLSVAGEQAPEFDGAPFFRDGVNTKFWTCSRNASAGSESEPDWEKLPLGQYCLVKPKGVPCTDPFMHGEFHFKADSQPTFSGNVGDVTFNGTDVTMRFCCRSDNNVVYPVELPAAQPFRLISFKDKCQDVKGLRYQVGSIKLFVSDVSVSGEKPRNRRRSWEYISFKQCYYYPPVYDCSEIVQLNSSQPSQTISTPGFEEGNRQSNRRCLYSFQVPPQSKLRVTFDSFDIDDDDKFHFRRFNRWTLPMILTNKNYPRQVVTEKDFLFMEFWSSLQATQSTKGVKVTVDVILPEDECYDLATNGALYAGNKTVAETMENCLPWKDTTGCEDFPWKHVLGLSNSGSQCRNPDGAMLQPWCYVSVHGKMCQRRYCDVCNHLDVMDRFPDCARMTRQDKKLCRVAFQRSGCSKTCDRPVNDAVSKEAQCWRPAIPKAGTLLEPLKDVYKVGEKVTFGCVYSNLQSEREDIECTVDGWTHLDTVCPACPRSWTGYGDRCWKWRSRALPQERAYFWCRQRKGTIFKIRDENDLQMLREFKQKSNLSGAKYSTWVNAQMNPTTQQWYTMDDKSPVTFFEWSKDANTNDVSYPYLYLRGEDRSEPGTFATEPSKKKRLRFFCEMPRKETTCVDTSKLCQQTLAQFPDFCTRSETRDVARQNCPKSCGFCQTDKVRRCEDPNNKSHKAYKRVSPSNVTSVGVGEIMEFQCRDGLYSVRGGLRRVCGVKGRLLGMEPRCSAKLKAVDINKGDIRKRPDVLSTEQAFLVDVDGFRMPFNGSISYWYFYAMSPGELILFIYRKDPVSGTFQEVGSNHVTVTHDNTPWSYRVPKRDRIRVQEGDLFGSFSTDVEIAATSCYGTQDKPMNLLKQEALSYTDEPGVMKEFTSQHCLSPSLGLRVEPL